MRNVRRSWIALMVTLSVIAGVAIMATPAIAVDFVRTCATEAKVYAPSASDAAVKTPVILVHGLWSDSSMWAEGNPAMGSTLEKDPRLVIFPFDYQASNSAWITTGDTASRLAKTIVCYSRLYGGKKVIVVAHSMGGLLTRAALTWAAYGTFVKDAVGHAITIGTPHLGAGLANLQNISQVALCDVLVAWRGQQAMADCEKVSGLDAVPAMRPGSPELAALPRIPAGITVKAIAGEVIWWPCAVWACGQKQSRGGDLIVSVASALDEYTATGIGDGKEVFQCTDAVAVLLISKPYCEHNELTRSEKVQDSVAQSIRAYLASVKSKSASAARPSTRPTPAKTSATHKSTTASQTFFGMMTLQLLPGMKAQGLGGEGANAYEVSCTNRSVCPAFMVYSPREVGGDLGWRSWAFTRCQAAQGGPPITFVAKGTRQIGNRTAAYSEANFCTVGQPRIARFWEVTDGSIFIVDTSGNSSQWPATDAMLAAATWK